MGDFGNFNSNYAGNFAQNPTIVDAQATYVREQAERVSVRRVYAEMTVGLIVTTLVAMFTQSTGALYSYLYATCLLYTSPSPRDRTRSRMPSSA